MKIRIFSFSRKYLRAYVIAVIGFFTSLALFYALQLQEKHHILRMARLGIESIMSNLRSEMAYNAHILNHVALEKRTNEGLSPNVKNLLTHYSQFIAMGEASPLPNIQWLRTHQGLSADKEQLEKLLRGNIAQIHKAGSIWVSSPIAIKQEKQAFLMVIKPENVPRDSYIIGLIDCNSLINYEIHIPGMLIGLFINQLPVYSGKIDAPLPSWLLTVPQKLYGALLEIKARESSVGISKLRFSNDEPLSWITLVLGLLISILLARSVALSELLQERGKILDQINQDLKCEITEHIQTEESKKNLERALMQSQKLQAVGTLAGGIAHDFNNILYAIRGYVDLAREDLPKDCIVYKNLGKVLEGTHRGQDLVARILSFSRRQHHEHNPLRLKTEVSGALALLRPTIPESVDIQFQAHTDGNIIGNKTQMHQIIVNLINNAVDAMDGEGSIKINLDRISEKKLPHEFLSANGANYCRIEISDTGHGMDASTLRRIFEPFFTTKEVGKGAGLGLSTVHAIVKEHNGEIVVNSQLGRGTTFTLFFLEYLQEETQHG